MFFLEKGVCFQQVIGESRKQRLEMPRKGVWKVAIEEIQEGEEYSRDPNFYYPTAPLLLLCVAEQNVGLRLPTAISNNQFCPSY